MDLDRYKINSVPPTVYYIPSFITSEEESLILKNVYSVPKPKWTCLSNRRLQDYGGVPHEKGMIPEKIPSWLKLIMNKIDQFHLFGDKKVNQVLVNEYLPGQGIMPHSDGPLFYPTIATITCGSHTVLEFSKNDEKREKICDLMLESCSLVIIKDDMYSKYLHSISERVEDKISDCVNIDNNYNNNCRIDTNDVLKRSTRVSLTIRSVHKVLKIKLW